MRARIIRLVEEKAKAKLETTRREDVGDEELHASKEVVVKKTRCECCFQ